MDTKILVDSEEAGDSADGEEQQIGDSDGDGAMSNETSWEDYLNDDFNLTGLSQTVPYYDYALDLILDMDIELETFTEEQQEVIEASAEVLYGLIHARYITSQRGMQRMLDKFVRGDFGRCQRVHCHGQAVLPTGLSDLPRRFFVSVFCPRCRQLFHPKSSRHLYLDGAYFGTTFPHLFVLSHPDLMTSLHSEDSFVPRIFGFKIHVSSSYYAQGSVAAPSVSSSISRGERMQQLQGGDQDSDDDAADSFVPLLGSGMMSVSGSQQQQQQSSSTL